MLAAIFIVIIILGWLLWETKFLTVDLMDSASRCDSRPNIDISGLLMMAIGMVFLAIGFVLFPIKEYEEYEEYEEYYCLYKDPVLHRVLKLYRGNRMISPSLLSMAVYKTRIYARMQSEVEPAIEFGE